MAANAEAGAGAADTDAGRTVAAAAREALSHPAAGADAGTGGGASAVTDGLSGTGSKPTRRQRIWRATGRGIGLLAVAVTVMMTALAIGTRSNDSAIDDHLGTATATVLSVSPLRTGIEFVDAAGATVRPAGGVLYPGLLSLGQQFVVEYSTQDPQIARVAGRAASVGTIMIVLILVGTYVVAAPLIWWCRRRSRLPLLPFRRDRELLPVAAAGQPAVTTLNRPVG
jgi:hypothetical protein